MKLDADYEGLVVLVYTSAATQDMSREALLSMLEGGRRRNAGRGVTGVLVYHDGMFMQALEGPRRVVDRLFAIISADPRHRAIFVLLHEPTTTRVFAEHTMAFRDLSGEPRPDGYDELLNAAPGSVGPAHARTHVHRLLKSFATTVLRHR